MCAGGSSFPWSPPSFSLSSLPSRIEPLSQPPPTQAAAAAAQRRVRSGQSTRVPDSCLRQQRSRPRGFFAAATTDQRQIRSGRCWMIIGGCAQYCRRGKSLDSNHKKMPELRQALHVQKDVTQRPCPSVNRNRSIPCIRHREPLTEQTPLLFSRSAEPQKLRAEFAIPWPHVSFQAACVATNTWHVASESSLC